MCTRQGELRLAVVEDGARPADGRVAGRAVLRKSGRSVIRVFRGIEVREVARTAGRGDRRELIVCVTLRARKRSVSSR